MTLMRNDIDTDFFLSFLDPRPLLHAKGFYEAAETLQVATSRKSYHCYEKLRLKPGDRVGTSILSENACTRKFELSHSW
jgi:cyclopropane fatty-acyl-phospholipid synthase-like methyltransferase